MSSISSGTTSTTGYVVSSDTTGALVLKTGSAATTAVTIDTSQNVGIGTGSPSYKLQVEQASDTGFAMSNSSSVTSGNRGSLAMFNSSNSTVGLIRFGAVTDNVGTEIQFYTRPAASALTQSMTLDSSGNLLLGTTSNIASTRRELVMVGTNGAVVSLGNTSTADRFQIVSDSSENALLINKANTPMIFYTNNTQRMRITEGGNLVIGATAATQKLEVSGGAAQFNGGSIDGVVGDAVYFGNTTYPTVQKNRIRSSISAGAQGNILIFETCTGTTGVHNEGQFTLLGDGKVGIGTSSPGAKLDVAGSAYVRGDSTDATFTSAGQLAIKRSTSDPVLSFHANAGSQIGNIQMQASGTCGITVAVAQPLAFTVNGSERARISSTGELLLGATGDTGYKFTAYSASSAQMLYLRSGASGDAGTAMIRLMKSDSTNTTSQIFIQFIVDANNTNSGQINANGASQAAFGSFSDVRLKENIENLPSQLNNILALRPVEFDYKNGSGHQIGFIAQEMEQVYPDAIGVGEDEMLTVTGWSKTEARLVKAIQEQQLLIQQLQADVAFLKGVQQ
jgi:hypothetical protein